ncbi:tape measure protein [Devosia sp. D6-9]|nr:tape measure protein [Devosia sp. D6-9]
MATTIEELRAVMRMELKPFMRDLQQMNGISAKAARQVEQTWMATNRRLDHIGKGMAQSIIAPLTGIGAALGARELIRLTDTWTDLNGRVRIAAGGMKEGADVMERLGDMARRTYSSLETTAESYLTNSQALKELGYSTNQQLDFTEALNNALVVSGAKGQRAEQVINALGKAMAFGELRGENLNTVIQTGGRVAQALADGLGVTTNELRKLGEQGKLKSSSVFTALTSQMETLRSEADGMQATIGDALTLLRNSFLEYVGGADQAAGASAKIAEAIILVSDNLGTVANAALVAATAITGALAGRAMIQAGATIISTTKALSEFVRIARAAQGLGGLGPAFASLGSNAGVIGAVVGGAAALALGYFANQAMEAEARTERFNAMLDRMGIAAKDSAEKLDEASAAQARLSTAEGLAQAQQDLSDAEAKLAEFTAELEKMLAYFRTSAQLGGEQAKVLVDIVDGYMKGGKSAQWLKDKLDALAKSQPDWAEGISSIKEYTAGIDSARAALGRLATEMAGIDPTLDPKWTGASWSGVLNFGRGPQVDTDLGQFPTWNKPATYSDIRDFANSGGKSSKSKASKSDPYGDATKDMQRRIDMLVEETRVLGDLNPLINDYGYAVEKLRAQQELENAATKAGLALSPERRGEIEKLAEGYAQATVEAARLAEAQNATVAQMETLRDASRNALDTIIDGFLEGKDAGEIFGNVLKDLGKQLLNMGMTGLFGGGSNGGFGLIGQLLGVPGRATGGRVTAGQPYLVGEKRPEVFVPDQSGTILPRVPTSMPSRGGGDGAPSITYAPVIDARGADAGTVARIEAVLQRQKAELVPTIRNEIMRRKKWGAKS